MKVRLLKKPCQASTMIEVVVAVGILAILGAGIVGSFSAARANPINPKGKATSGNSDDI